MKRISKKRLIWLGFVKESWSKWYNGAVLLEIYPKDTKMKVYVCSDVTTDTMYARQAEGVKTERDLVLLCNLINGKLK